ncbi:hypothetical protein [Nonomuraea zeae]|uniref:Uncharacterized protein n=1 Tax=Nonomuraea zeae TaxID=1642303 RepID=A0A5S4F0W9_9ACTN|nr:hypothetical protein [Nonomuraea zeae]TMR09715.1 hypothetical protein ETD85_61185 [Nonomuraea zeae]
MTGEEICAAVPAERLGLAARPEPGARVLGRLRGRSGAPAWVLGRLRGRSWAPAGPEGAG